MRTAASDVRVQDRNHNHVTAERAEDDTLLEVAHSGGYRLTITADPDSHRVTGLHAVTEDGPLRLRAYGYDERGNLTEVINAVGALTRFTYYDAHRSAGRRDSNDTTSRRVEPTGPSTPVSTTPTTTPTRPCPAARNSRGPR
ncbi:hypothetical protein [Streptomyces sp. Ru62]|uniref:hypothetical protein n=1 Tax=Streptomyces sp. Ru62 TaxID=2080745 RepID=UPI0021565ABD|nr:hypothetical protein [Streptomyces sp. Ru62]